MEEKSERILFWTPRVLIIIFALFLAIFSLDVFDSASSFAQIAIGLFMHNLPSIVLLLILIISWRNDLVGGIIFLALGVLCVIGTIVSLLIIPLGKINPLLIIGSIIFLLIGTLFFVGYKRRKR